MNAERKGEIILKATEKVIRGLVEARKQFEGGFDISLN